MYWKFHVLQLAKVHDVVPWAFASRKLKVPLPAAKYYEEPLSTTRYYSVLQSTTMFFAVLQSTTPVLQSITRYHNKFYSVLQSTTPNYKVFLRTAKYYSVQQSTTVHIFKKYFKGSQNTIKIPKTSAKYYKAWQSTKKYQKVSRSTSPYYKVRQSTTMYYKVLQSITQYHSVLPSTSTRYFSVDRTAEDRCTPKVRFEHCTGWWPSTHSIGKFFLWLMVFFHLKLRPPAGNYLYYIPYNVQTYTNDKQ